MTEKINTIKTEQFNNFIWKRIPIEHNYITIACCLSEYKENNSENFFENIPNESTKKLLQYIINIMPSYGVVNIDNFRDFVFHKDKVIDSNNEISKIKNIKFDSGSDTPSEKDLEYIEEKIKKLNNKKTYIFTYPSLSLDTTNDVSEIENNLKKMLNLSISNYFNESHKLCFGKIENIPKHILCMADYVFFEDKDVLNKYLEMFNHNIRINKSNTSIYVLDKCNYEYYNLFSFNNHLQL
jgi:hypothetical protein